jgi:predicted SAM-dependent methyltransferase
MLKKMIKATIRSLGYELMSVKTQKFQVSNDPSFNNTLEKYRGELEKFSIQKAHYGCGRTFFGDGWVNIDKRDAISRDKQKLYMYMGADLTGKHPFPSGQFLFSFAEDFLEHLSQDDSIIFLSEVFRCLKKGGVLRLSFPSLKGVLNSHFRSADYEGASVGKKEAYSMWGHKHFYCEESLNIVAKHIGFSDIKFVEFGKSDHEELRNLDHREHQKDLNMYAELIK